MKLSEKGYWQVRNVCCEYNYNHLKIAEELGFFDFKQEHFKGAVVLTIEEAKVVLKAIDIWNVEDDEIYDKLEERIEHAEKENEIK